MEYGVYGCEIWILNKAEQQILEILKVLLEKYTASKLNKTPYQ